MKHDGFGTKFGGSPLYMLHNTHKKNFRKNIPEKIEIFSDFRKYSQNHFQKTP